jgi:TonB-linked SusC/RagA family outer membrane protein
MQTFERGLSPTPGAPYRNMIKYLIMMKLTILLILTLSINAVAETASAQEKISLSVQNVSLKKAFKLIESQTSFRFVYTDEDLLVNQNVSVNVKSQFLDEVMKLLLQKTTLSYKLMGDDLVVIATQPTVPNTVTTKVAFRVSGKVLNAASQPLAKVAILEKGTSNGTTTADDGSFSLNVASEQAVLVVSFVGYKLQQVSVNGRASITVNLLEEVKELNDVVVVGYGTQKKANLTGAVDMVSSDVLENRSLTNLNQGLQGVLPNLNIKMLDGKPNQAPRFNIRGTTSIGQGGSALVLIDGVEGDPGIINPNDVESVSILKDAASASIYGARGAFGVVLITTKNPAKGKTSITYSANFSTKEPTNVPSFANDAYTFAKMFAESSVAWDGSFPQAVNKTLKFSQAYLAELEKRSKTPGGSEVEIDPVTGEYVYYASTDWYAQLYKPSNGSKEHNITVSGGSDKTSFMVTGRYFGQEGLFRYNSDDYTMMNFRAKGSVQVYPWLKFDNNTDFSNSKYHNPLNVGEGSGIFRNIADEGHPLAPLLNPDGTLTASSAYTVGDFYYGKSGYDFDKSVLRNRTGFTAQFFRNVLRLKADFTFQVSDNNETRKQVPLPYSSKPGVIAYLGTTTNDLREIRQRTQYIATNIYAEYENTFKQKHYFKVLVGYNYEQSTNKNLLVQRNGLIYENANDLNLALGQSILASGGYEQWAIVGGFSRINYAFKDRYLIEVNGRYDGSSKFPADQRYGFFPSVSAGWRVNKEAFWKVSPKIISDLKFRASYGSLGNGNIGSYVYQEQFNVSQSGIILNGIRPQQTSRPSVLPDGLTWETSTTTNFGLDFGMLSNRLRFTGDVYVRKTTDMFTVGVTLPAVFGATSPRGNYADLETKGWELTLSWKDNFKLGSSPFNYDVRFTLADNSAVITKYNNPQKLLSDYYEGMRVGEIWGYVTEGFFTSADDIAKHANQKLFLSTSSGQTFPGDIKLLDKNGDGVVNPGTGTFDNPGDRSVIGNSAPRYMYGINVGADWKNFFFSAFFQGVGKQEWFPSTEAGVFWGQYNRPYNKIPTWQLTNRWTPETPDGYMPRYVSRLANRPGGILLSAQTRYLQNVAYCRMKNIQVGYNLPAKWMSKIKAANARLYISAENLLTWSPLYNLTRDMDVESIGPSDQLFSPGGNAGDGYNYPMMKSIVFGLSITF